MNNLNNDEEQAKNVELANRIGENGSDVKQIIEEIENYIINKHRESGLKEYQIDNEQFEIDGYNGYSVNASYSYDKNGYKYKINQIV